MLFVHAVEAQGGSACLPLAVMLSTAIFQIGHLASVLLHPRPAIASGAISRFSLFPFPNCNFLSCRFGLLTVMMLRLERLNGNEYEFFQTASNKGFYGLL